MIDTSVMVDIDRIPDRNLQISGFDGIIFEMIDKKEKQISIDLYHLVKNGWTIRMK